MDTPDQSWFFSIPWQDQESAYVRHISAIGDELAKREPRFSKDKGEFDFDFLGKVGGASFNRIRATPDRESRNVRVRLQHEAWDDGHVSEVAVTEFAFPLHRLTGDPAKDASHYAAGLQWALQTMYLEREDMRGGFDVKLQEAFQPDLGTEAPLLAFLDRAEAVQKAHQAIITRRIIALSDHLRDPVPSVPRTIPQVAESGRARQLRD